jgi:hypothetical protein
MCVDLVGGEGGRGFSVQCGGSACRGYRHLTYRKLGAPMPPSALEPYSLADKAFRGWQAMDAAAELGSVPLPQRLIPVHHVAEIFSLFVLLFCQCYLQQILLLNLRPENHRYRQRANLVHPYLRRPKPAALPLPYPENPFAKFSAAMGAGVIERDQERSGFQPRNRFKLSRYAGPFSAAAKRFSPTYETQNRRC